MWLYFSNIDLYYTLMIITKASSCDLYKLLLLLLFFFLWPNNNNQELNI